MKIRIQGYECLNKVVMTKAICENSSLNLKESKSITNQLLEDGSIEFDINPSWQLNSLIAGLKSANANLKILE